MPKYKDLYPSWSPDTFSMPGTRLTSEQTCVSAFKASRAATQNKGGNCPCCGQHVQVYRRSIYKHMAKCLIWLVAEYQRRNGDWVSLKDGPLFRGGDNAKLTYWHLILSHEDESNLYKPTEIAVQFVKREITLPKYAYVYNGNVQGFSKERVSINECLEGDFDMTDLGIAAWSEFGG